MIEMPKRLQPPAPPGALLKGIAVAAPRSPKAEPREDKDYLALVRRLPCLYCGLEPCGEAAHVGFNSLEFGRTRALGRRPPDRFAVPLCRDDHLNARHAQHKGNEEAFWTALGIRPYEVARNLHAKRGDFIAMHAVVIRAISERTKT